MKQVFVFALLFSFMQGFAQDCNNVHITPGSGNIKISGLSPAPIADIQVFNSSWASILKQSYTNPADSLTISPLTAAQYFVKVNFYTSSWTHICEKSEYAPVTGGAPPPPPTDSCRITFQKTFGSTGGDETGNDIAKAADGGYVVAGQSSVTGTSNYDALLMKFDTKGNLLWSKTYGGAQPDLFRTVKTTTDGGIIAGGITKSFGNAAGDAWLVKTDAN